MREALYYKQKQNQKIECVLCPHNCIIKEGKRGICNVRKNINGKLYSENYGKVTGIGFDPIEKKPLYHFHPGEIILSVGSLGCNFKCRFCQNWEISQSSIDEVSRFQTLTIEDVIKFATERKNNIGIAYTYNEPTIYFEFMLDLAKEVQNQGMKNVMVTNGFINPDPLNELLEYIDAFSIDLKAFTEEFYKKNTSGKLEPVKDTLKQIQSKGKFLEITNLVIPSLNDDTEKFREMIDWIATEIGSKTALHLSRYFPCYKSNIEATPVSKLQEFYNIAQEKLSYVYLGNVPSAGGSETFCDQCGTLLVSRKGYFTTLKGIDEEGKCKKCGNKVFER
ncbi:MAG: AmmeMemoRadiSam system radical SAM enzyme [Bacteroidales bacterium]